MRLIVRLFSLTMACLILLSSAVLALSAAGVEESTADDRITEPYKYPILPGTPEWKALPSTLFSKVEVCRVPQEMLERMTTPALLETVITYPLFTNVFAFNTFAQGLSSVSAYFGGIHELLSRPDAYDVIVLYSAAHAYFNRDRFATDLDARLQANRLEVLQRLAEDYQEKPPLFR